MKRLTWTITVAVLLLLVASAFGQAMLRPGKDGRLVARPIDQSRCAETCLMDYSELGIVFQTDKGGAGVLQVVLTLPEKPLGGKRLSIADQVVPGVGAYGVRLGMPKEEARELFPGYSESEFAKAWQVSRDFNKTRSIVVSFVGSSESPEVGAVNVYGEFRTPEGITEKSSMAGIRKAYGTPDKLMEWVPGWQFPWRKLPYVLMPGLGLLAGLLIRGVYRVVRSNSIVVGLSVVSGAFAQCAVAVAWNVLYSRAVGIPVSWGLMVPYVAVAAAISGGLGALFVAISRNRIRGWLGSVVVLVLVLLMAPMGSLAAAFLVARGFPIVMLQPYAVLNALFLLGMFITGMPRQARATG